MKKYLPYLQLGFALAITMTINHFGPEILHFLNHGSEASLLLAFFSFASLAVLSFVVFHLSQNTVLPPFVVAIFFGLGAQTILSPVVDNKIVLSDVVAFGATLILFSGGLETPFTNFKKLFLKIASLSFPGLLITAILFGATVTMLNNWFGLTIGLPVAILLGAVLASTDPAAIIPILKGLRFKNRDTKDIIISESALTDVTGTLLTVAFLGIIVAGKNFDSIGAWYGALATGESLLILGKQILFGVLFGLIGFGLLYGLSKLKERHRAEYEADAAFFLFVPIVIFTFAVPFGGSGYLAAFIAGLLYVLTKHLHETERFFNHTIEGFLKPTIFLLLGALVNVQSLLEYAWIGIIAALVFMFVIRPFSVFVSLILFRWFGKEKLSTKEMVFISFVRETGAIPAVLLVTIVSLGLPGMEALVPIGMWVILLTLIIEPPLTPWLAAKLKIAEPISDTNDLDLDEGDKPFVVLGSRGHSYKERLPKVVDWADTHRISRIVLLHCLEDKYTLALADKIRLEADQEFAKINTERQTSGKPVLDFDYVSRTGFLQTNIDDLAREHSEVTAIFVGRKVLDYRLEEIKNLQVPIFFVD